MKITDRTRYLVLAARCLIVSVTLGLVASAIYSPPLGATSHVFPWLGGDRNCQLCPTCEGSQYGDFGGTWYWLRSPEEEKRLVMGLFNRYCIRCHGVDGRGVWDIPGVPNFTNVRWQECRSDAQLANIILQGRGAVMPQFRGTMTLEEAWAMARYLRTFVPGTEISPPDFSDPKKTEKKTK